jgi:hypothetical protein
LPLRRRDLWLTCADKVVEVIETPLEAIVDAEYLHEEDGRAACATVPFYRINGYQV